MENLLYFFETRYILFIVLSVLMLFALIGYFAKKKADKNQPYKLADENAIAEEQLANLAQNVNKQVSINDLMHQNATVATSVAPQPQVVQPVTQVQAQPNVQPQAVETVQSLGAAPQQVAAVPQANQVDRL